MASRTRKKVQFYYDPETCTYHPVKFSKRKFTLRATLVLVAALTLSAGVLTVLNMYYPTPKEAFLTAQQEELLAKWYLLETESADLTKKLESLWISDEEIRRILELDSLPMEIRAAGIGGAEDISYLMKKKVVLERRISEIYKEVESLKAKLAIQSASLDTLMQYANAREEFWAAIPAIQPVENKDLRRLSTIFGMRLHPIYGKYLPHRGFDFMGKVGVPIYATGDGKVRLARMTYGGFGNLVEIDHGYGYRTRYAHLDTFNVRPGEEVKRGQIIGFMGNTGRSAGPHLHYEVLKDGTQVNPIGFFERGMSEEAYARLLDKASHPSIPLD